MTWFALFAAVTVGVALWDVGRRAIAMVERVAGRMVDARFPVSGPTGVEIPVPDDIVALAMSYAEEWAQEDTLKAAREKYANLRGTGVDELTKWNLVRKALGLGVRDGAQA